MMKAATIVSSLLGAAAVAVASPVAARAVPDHFTVTGFKASCAANGAPGCRYVGASPCIPSFSVRGRTELS